MKLEVGKKYVIRDSKKDDTEVVWVRVDAIRIELAYPVTCTLYYVNKEYTSENYLIDGRFSKYYPQCHMDLVAEYTEPQLKLGPEHVGKRVKLRNGDVSLVTGYSKDPIPCRVLTAYTSHTTEGYVRPSKSEHSHDIIEILD